MKKLLLTLLLAGVSGLPRLSHADPTPTAKTHVMWNNASGQMSLWTMTDDGHYTYQNFGPYAGWTAKSLSDSSDGVTKILWTHSPDGQMSLWTFAPDGSHTNTEYGPYVGWSALGVSRSAPGSGLTGAAGGDLVGLYPNPTIAPGVVNHTKLASDAASLAQVSGGLLTNTDGFHLDVKNDLIVHGTVIAVQGNGSGTGNNNKAGRALVDGGLGGLIINFANDFGKVDIDSSTTVHGTLGADSDISSNGVNFFLHGAGGGVGNNNHAARALVDGGSTAGLVINFANDFGQVSIASDTTVHGHLFTDGPVDSAQYISTKSTMYAASLQLTGGSDLAEPYKIAASANINPLPGMVVAIDPTQTGQMRVCTRAYDTAVGGIISGAGGVQPGITLRQKGTVADGTLPLACTGRVWCWCDADAGGAISPGDLLTTSATPGHAMRVGDYDKARGAILGKAMSPLKSGKGLVLVLVTLE